MPILCFLLLVPLLPPLSAALMMGCGTLATYLRYLRDVSPPLLASAVSTRLALASVVVERWIGRESVDDL